MFLQKLNTFFELKCTSTSLCRRVGTSKRNGLSIIEVLTALTVAIIGVFGVMSLIPFAVSQTQLGLDLDNANLYGRNAQEQFESFDYEKPFEDAAFFPVDIPGQMPWLIPTLLDYQNDDMRDFLVDSFGTEDPEPVLEPVLTNFSFYPNRRTFAGLSFNPTDGAPLPVADAEYYGPQVYHIDPLGVSGGVVGFPYNSLNLATFPPIAPEPFPIPLRSATLADKTSLPDQSGIASVPLQLSDAEVFRMCNDSDRLSFAEVQTSATSDSTETEPMLQEFIFAGDIDGDGEPDPVKRYSFSGISWSALATPLKDPLKVRNAPAIGDGSNPSKITGFRMSYLVHKDRSLIISNDDPADPERLINDEFGRMVYAPVKRLNFAQGRPGAPPVADSSADQNDNFLNRGYVQSVNRIAMEPLGLGAEPLVAEERAELFDDTFRKGSWVMLINRKPEVLYTPAGGEFEGDPFLGGPFFANGQFDLAGSGTVAPDEPLSADEPGFNTQIGFFRIISSQNGLNRASGLHEFNATLTVSGGGFDFFYSDIPGTETYVVHLNNVVNVFEKTFTLE